MKRKAIAAVCLTVVATTAFAVGGEKITTFGSTLISRAEGSHISHALGSPTPNGASPVRNAGQEQPAAAPQPPAEIPKQIVYGILFREMAAYKKKAAELERNSQDATSLRAYHRTRLNLDDRQAAELDRVATESEREVEEFDNQAKQIIDEERAKHPDGKLKEGESLPLPPAELGALQKQRDAVILRARESLRRALGEEEFRRFDDFVQQDISSKMKPVTSVPANFPAPDALRIQRARERSMR